MYARAASGWLSGNGDHIWLARRTYQAPATVRLGDIPKPAATIPTDATMNRRHSCR
ncbi:hypothetical protein AB0E63_22620 [Kribbella sp. NPDC026596]|uniref:hypothetical protein n=1 Tax=Kribbella sp. NPDC026596 TaxID=3155122 RepID=UPI0033DEA288